MIIEKFISKVKTFVANPFNRSQEDLNVGIVKDSIAVAAHDAARFGNERLRKRVSDIRKIVDDGIEKSYKDRKLYLISNEEKKRLLNELKEYCSKDAMREMKE